MIGACRLRSSWNSLFTFIPDKQSAAGDCFTRGPSKMGVAFSAAKQTSGHSNAHAARKAFIAAADEAELIMRLALPTDARRCVYVRPKRKPSGPYSSVARSAVKKTC